MKESIFRTKPIARLGARMIDRQEWNSITSRVRAIRAANRIKKHDSEKPEIIKLIEKVKK